MFNGNYMLVFFRLYTFVPYRNKYQEKDLKIIPDRKKTHGSNCSPKKQFQSINTFAQN